MLVLLTKRTNETYPYSEQQPPYAPAGSHVAPPKSFPQRPSERGAVDEADGAAAALTTELEDDVHPETHPAPQCAGVFPHYIRLVLLFIYTEDVPNTQPY